LRLSAHDRRTFDSYECSDVAPPDLQSSQPAVPDYGGQGLDVDHQGQQQVYGCHLLSVDYQLYRWLILERDLVSDQFDEFRAVRRADRAPARIA
jgi:hypothetical protein